MAVAQDLVLSDPESDIITHESTSALHSSEHDGDEEVALIRPSSPNSSPRSSLLASRLSSIVSSSRKRRRNKALEKERVMMNRLHRQLVALRSMVPPSARSSQHSVIADALKYKKALKNEIHELQRALPFAQQKVNVVRGDAGLQISLVCKKKSGLLIALMEAMDSFGIVLSKVNVCCRNGIVIDALSTQDSTPHVDSLLKVALMTTIARFSAITSV